MSRWFLAIMLGPLPLAQAQNLPAVPPCAQTCLSNSTASAGSCSGRDIKCLCANAEYVNTLSCCLATNCDTSDQQQAILFNIQECATVNETAPSFVGCSPLGLTSSIILGSPSSGSGSTRASALSGSPTMVSMGGVSDSLVSTITGPVNPIITLDTRSTITATFNGQSSLLTGNCTSVTFAVATNAIGMVTEFPQIGCSDQLEVCCPFDVHQNAMLTQCPPDYFTTAGACCPVGWQVYFSSLGGQTPCYTMPSQTFVPAGSATISGIAVVTDHVFTRKYELTGSGTSHGLSAGAKAGIAMGICGAALLFAAFVMFVSRRRMVRPRAMISQSNNRVTRSLSPTISPTISPAPQELAGTESKATSPASGSSNRPVSSVSPPAPNQSIPMTVAGKWHSPQELAGSTFIHEHHPAYTGSGQPHPALMGPQLVS